MAAPEGKVPILDSVGAAMRDWRANLKFNLITGLIGAAALTLISFLSLSAAGNSSVAMLLSLASTVVGAFVFATFLGLYEYGPSRLRERLPSDGMRVWCAMAVVGFFLFIVCVVAGIPAFALLMTALSPYYGEIEAVADDQAAVFAIIERFAQENAGLILAVVLVYGVIWLLLTSRLYLAAPATVSAQKILTFETWSWTKNNMLRICGARLLLLAPASILVFAVQALAGGAVGANAFDPNSVAAAIMANPAGYGLTIFIGHAFNFTLYRGLEAALSTYLYRGLRPSVTSP